ncbi:MAG: sigma-70 family RNA polymerase sigma factor [Planctomycetaceae bacterium]|nr:sigma-70 family RNA polymerase sigma factor [Planctomycetaceae bacterium]
MRYPETRPSLIVRLQGQRNERAWEEFVRAYEPFLNSLVARRGVPGRHVPDVTQQILAAIARSVEQWKDDGQPASFRRWLSRVARNVVIRYMTKERREPAAEGGSAHLDLLRDVAVEPDQAQVQEYDFELILWAAEEVRDEFRPTSWTAFWETLIEGRSVEDVSRKLGVSPGSIYMSRSRIMARIREKVREANA